MTPASASSASVRFLSKTHDSGAEFFFDAFLITFMFAVFPWQIAIVFLGWICLFRGCSPIVNRGDMGILNIAIASVGGVVILTGGYHLHRRSAEFPWGIVTFVLGYTTFASNVELAPDTTDKTIHGYMLTIGLIMTMAGLLMLFTHSIMT